jgi:hypothetical protein
MLSGQIIETLASHRSTISSLNAQTSASHLSGENPAAARSKSVLKAHI